MAQNTIYLSNYIPKLKTDTFRAFHIWLTTQCQCAPPGVWVYVGDVISVHWIQNLKLLFDNYWFIEHGSRGRIYFESSKLGGWYKWISANEMRSIRDKKAAQLMRTKL